MEEIPKPRFVSVRAIGIACALMPILALWVVQSELIWYSGHSTAISLFFHVTFVVFLLALMNMLVAQRWPKRALTGVELMTIYMMLSIAGTFCSHDFFQVLVPMLAYPNYAANPQNRWDELILKHIPAWAIVSDPEAIRGLAVGNSSLYKSNILLAWAGPLGFWLLLVMVLMAVLLSMNTGRLPSGDSTLVHRRPASLALGRSNRSASSGCSLARWMATLRITR